MLSFEPLQLAGGAGFDLQSLSIHIRDHKLRDLPTIGRSLEAHYGGFVFSQQRQEDESEARRLALEVPYGRDSRPGQVGEDEAQVYELGPEPEADDIDGRMPSVVTWSDGDMVYLVASDQIPVSALLQIAESLY